ncbi:DUF397 domain-containing protein [Nonomuraea cavernae]|uniref:Transcriptional regulator n=1 Tax=Nonomuraea cavernae TaxID=2045107 RepID=A0A917ZH36_9ACTN|nr:DUF397 domain-containing protein [Nonomuraea cavernae]MCA2189538.1 DUF397 domain-containing protein [Nonomuraea cavernae]GGO81677.1 transcriptional regulator [Nonomuraea cavernae]
MTGQEVDLSRAKWRTSSFSGSNGQCVQVAFLGGGHVAVRDSKDPTGPVLTFTAGEWNAFIRGAKEGEFEPHTSV